jgi:hypothetical protein
MAFCIDKSAGGIAGIIRDNQRRLAALEEIVFANNNIIDLPDVHIPDSIDNNIIYVPQKQEDDVFLDQLLEKLTDIKDQSSMLHLELESIKEMDNAIDTESDDNISICTENTEHLQELIDSNHDVKITAPCHNCKSCMKDKAKQIKKDRKSKEKQRRAYLRQLKINEKEVLILEQKELENKLTEFRNQIDRISDLSQKQKIELTASSLELNDSVAKIKTRI